MEQKTKSKSAGIGQIPKDWKIVKLGEIAGEVYRYPTYYNITYVEQGIPEIRGELIKDDGNLQRDKEKYRFISKEISSRFPRTILKEGDFVISVRGTMGKIAIVPKTLEGANITANLMRISLNRHYCNSHFFRQMFLSPHFQKALNSLSTQTTIKTIKAPVLKSISLLLPPFPEQKKIAEVLSTMDEAIRKVDEAIKKMERVKKGLMQKLLTKGIGHKESRDSEIGRIPKEWQIVKLRNVGEVTTGKTPSTSVKEYWNGDIPFITPGDLEDSKYVYETERHVTSEGASQVGILPRNAVLVVCIGSTIGKTGMIHKDSITNQQINSILCKSNIEPHYIYYSIEFRSKLLRSYSGVAAVPIIKKSLFENIKIPLPQTEEQQKIAEILSTVDKKLELEKKRREKLQRIKKGLMEELLTGKKRVLIGE